MWVLALLFWSSPCVVLLENHSFHQAQLSFRLEPVFLYAFYCLLSLAVQVCCTEASLQHNATTTQYFMTVMLCFCWCVTVWLCHIVISMMSKKINFGIIRLKLHPPFFSDVPPDKHNHRCHVKFFPTVAFICLEDVTQWWPSHVDTQIFSCLLPLTAILIHPCHWFG